MRLDNGDATDVFLIGRDENVEAIVHEMPVVITDLKVQSREERALRSSTRKRGHPRNKFTSQRIEYMQIPRGGPFQ